MTNRTKKIDNPSMPKGKLTLYVENICISNFKCGYKSSLLKNNKRGKVERKDNKDPNNAITLIESE